MFWSHTGYMPVACFVDPITTLSWFLSNLKSVLTRGTLFEGTL